LKVLTIGNCQATKSLYEVLRHIAPKLTVDIMSFDDVELEKTVMENDKKYDWFFLQRSRGKRFSEKVEKLSTINNVIVFPNIIFSGYQPDYVNIRKMNNGALVHHSYIVFLSYIKGIEKNNIIDLFNPNFISRLDYAKHFIEGKKVLVEHMNDCGMDGQFYFDKWHNRAPFMYTNIHPKLYVVTDIAYYLLNKAGINCLTLDVDEVINDPLRDYYIFPSFSPLAILGNSLLSHDQYYKLNTNIFTLEEFINIKHSELTVCEDELIIDQYRLKIFEEALEEYSKEKKKLFQLNPYKDKIDTSFWSRSVANDSPKDMEPVVDDVHLIGKSTKVATAGSCFAQHIARTLTQNGLNYYVTEDAPEELRAEEVIQCGYRLFSARYGNIYTARQLLQLLKRAYGEYRPLEQIWISKSGKLIDPFRPNMGEEFNSEEELNNSRDIHLSAVREMFENLDVFVFTLGLTEGWVNTYDSAVYPLAPGVISQHSIYDSYQFKNFSHDDILKDMIEFLELLRSVNRNAKVILTVSPVPLIATYEDEHVLSATTYSKSVLRVVANQLAKSFGFVSYFPSFEIITGHYNKGMYFEDDLRSVKDEGVAHVMRVFMKYLVSINTDIDIDIDVQVAEEVSIEKSLLLEIERNSDILCDEELIENNS